MLVRKSDFEKNSSQTQQISTSCWIDAAIISNAFELLKSVGGKDVVPEWLTSKGARYGVFGMARMCGLMGVVVAVPLGAWGSPRFAGSSLGAGGEWEQTFAWLVVFTFSERQCLFVESQFPIHDIDDDLIFDTETSLQQQFRQRILDLLLNCTFQGSGTIDRIESSFGNFL